MESLRKVKLPSHGAFGPGQDVEFILDMIGFDDEKKIFSSTTEEAIDEVLQRCIKSPENFDVTQLIPEDRKYLLYQLRIHSYGDEYHVTLGGEEYTISLENMDIVELDENFTMPEGTCPMSKDKVKLKKPTVSQMRKSISYAKEKAERMNLNYADVLYELMQVSKIDTINGEQRDNNAKLAWLKSLSGRDLAYIDYLSSKINVGYTGTVDVETPDGVRKAAVTMTGEFFRPRFDD